MSPSFTKSRTVRWAAPVGVVAVVGAALGTGPVIAAVRGRPSLPPKTAEQLLSAVTSTYKAGKLPPLSGTVVESASLGLPALPGGHAGASPVGLLSGSHTARVWYGDERHLRVALLDTGSETDYIRNGTDAWLWSSEKRTVRRYRITGKVDAAKAPPVRTPQETAGQVLAAVGATTAIRVDPTARVAGRAAYELVLSPKDGRSLVGHVRLALDGKTYVPLRVQVYPRGATDPAVQVGFTSVTMTRPASANFTFRPPPGAKVLDGKPDPAEKRAPGITPAAVKSIGDGWTTVHRIDLPPQNDTGHDVVGALRAAGTPVHGPWGHGHVLRTKLLSALLTDDDRLYVGAVTPDVLTQAAARR